MRMSNLINIQVFIRDKYANEIVLQNVAAFPDVRDGIQFNFQIINY